MADYPDLNPVQYSVYKFRVNLETVNKLSTALPSRITLGGNETVSEADNMKNTRSTFFPDVVMNNRALKHGDTFTVSGKKAIYLNNTYVSSPPSPNDLLIVVSHTA